MEGSGSWLDSHQWFSSSTMTAAMAVTTILSVIITAVLFLYSPVDSFLLSLDRKRKRKPPLPPGSFGFPIIGELFPFVSNPATFRNSRHAKHGPVFKTNIFGKLVYLEPPAGNKFLFTNEGKLVEMSWPTSTARLLGRYSLMVKTGDSHRLARRHMAPFLSPQSLAQYVPRMERHLQDHFKEFWRPTAGEDDGQEFEISILRSMRLVTYSIIADLLISLQLNETEELRRLHHIWMAGFGQLPIDIPGTPYRRALKARARIQEILGDMMSRRRAELSSGKSSPTQDLMSYMLTEPDDSGRMCTDEEIKDGILAFLLAGHETSATLLAMGLRFVALFPEVRQRLKDEHEAIAKQKSDGQGLTKEDLGKMKYTSWFIHETLRMQGITEVGFRKTLEDIEYGGFSIPKDWNVAWSAYSHKDPNIFQDPYSFNPERFDGQKIPPYAFVPFGGGPHICIGNEFAKMEMLMVIHLVMKQYTLSLVYPDEPFQYFPVPMQKSGTLMRVKKLTVQK